MENLLTLLKELQEEVGFIKEEKILELSKQKNFNLSELFALTSFYSFLYREPKGENKILVCKSLPCYLKNSELIVNTIKNLLNIDVGETTSDGKFSLELTNCIGCCDIAPAMLIQGKVYGNLTQEKIKNIIKTYL